MQTKLEKPEQKATPGPWEWRQRGNDEDGYHEDYILVGRDNVQIHTDGSAYGEYGPDIDVHGADARLIAAAPELLAACKALLHIFDRDLPEGSIGRKVCDEAIAAIAKAKGA